MTGRRGGVGGSGGRLWVEVAPAALCYGVVAYVVLHPLFAAPASTFFDPAVRDGLSLFSLGDIYTVLWVMSWGLHALLTDPLSVFDANIFHPAKGTLTSTEHMLGHLPVFGPVFAISGNPVLANQFNLFFELTMSGVAMYMLLRSWGCVRVAAIGGGLIFSYFPMRLHFLHHAHLQAGFYLVLAILAVDRFLTTGAKRWVVAFVGLFGLLCLCSFYLAYMSLVALAAYLGAVWMVRPGRPGMSRLVATAAATGLALLPFLVLALPYLDARSQGGVPSGQELNLLQYLSVRLHRLFLVRQEGYYIGASVTLLAVLGAVAGRRDVVPWARCGALAIVVVCIVFSMGPARGDFPSPSPYEIAAWGIPGFSAMRAPSRFVLLVMVGLAAAAGLGLDRIARIVRFGAHGGTAMAVAAIAVAIWDYGLLQQSVAVREAEVGERVPAVYRALADLPAGPVLEVPAGGRDDPLENERDSVYTYRSIFHWQRLLNGRAGYEPPSYAPIMALARALPDRTALTLLRRSTGLRYVVVHLAKMSAEQRKRWATPPGLKRLGRHGAAIIFEVEGDIPTDLESALLEPSPERSVQGTRLLTIGESDRRAALRVVGEVGEADTWALLYLELAVSNPTSVAWPVFTPIDHHRVGLGCRWAAVGQDAASGGVVADQVGAERLPYDLGPGDELTVPVACRASVPPGAYDLTIGVTQDGVWFDGAVTVGVKVVDPGAS